VPCRDFAIVRRVEPRARSRSRELFSLRRGRFRISRRTSDHMNTTYVRRPCAATGATLFFLVTSLTACSDSSSDADPQSDSTSTGGAPTGSGGALEEGTGGAQVTTGGTGSGGMIGSGG